MNRQNTELTSEEDAARFVEQEIKTFARTSPLNRLPHDHDYIIFDEPLVRFADGGDPLFTEYKTIIAPTHLTPHEALAQAYDKNPADLPRRLSVISWVLPIQENTRKANRREKHVPSRLWSHTRWYGEQFNDEMRRHVTEILTARGYLAVAPMLQPYFKTNSNEKGPYSNWSERHIAYVAGHGTFSLSDGFITERGIAHRCGSVVTDLELPPSLRTVTDHYSNCLFYVGRSCKACIARCPAAAISEQGHDKLRCQEYLREIGYIGIKEYDPATSVAGCGLCQTSVPCEYRIPKKKKK